MEIMTNYKSVWIGQKVSLKKFVNLMKSYWLWYSNYVLKYLSSVLNI
jgi:hypothetical protein